MMNDDRDLVRRCLAGERAAFDVLYDRHERRVLGLLRRLTGNEAEALDLAQETFLTAYRTLGAWQGRGAFSTWLCGIAARLSADARRRAQGRETEPLDEERLEPDFRFDPLAHCTRSEAEQRIEAAVASLPPLSREAFVLVRIEGFSYREAAAVLEVPVGTLQSRLARAVRQLQKTLWDLAGAPAPSPVPQVGPTGPLTDPNRAPVAPVQEQEVLTCNAVTQPNG